MPLSRSAGGGGAPRRSRRSLNTADSANFNRPCAGAEDERSRASRPREAVLEPPARSSSGLKPLCRPLRNNLRALFPDMTASRVTVDLYSWGGFKIPSPLRLHEISSLPALCAGFVFCLFFPCQKLYRALAFERITRLSQRRVKSQIKVFRLEAFLFQVESSEAEKSRKKKL